MRSTLAIAALAGGVSAALGAALGPANGAVGIAALGGAGSAAGSALLAARTIDAPRIALLVGLTAALLVGGAAWLAPPTLLLALVPALLALLGARAAEVSPLYPLGAPAAALAAAWLHPAVGGGTLLALVLLFGAGRPWRERARREDAPQLAGLVLAATAFVLLPASLLPAGRGLRVLILLLALMGNLLLGSRIPRLRLGSAGRRLTAVIAAALVPLVLLGALVAMGRVARFAGPEGLALLLAATAILLGLLGGVVLGATLLLDTRHRAKGWIVAVPLATLGALPMGVGGAILLVPGASVLWVVLGSRAFRIWRAASG